MTATAASSAGMRDSVVSSCARAREVSNSVPRPASKTRLDHAQRLALVVGVLARHAQALLQTAQLEVAARHLADDRHLQRGQIVRAGARVRALRLDVAPHAAEQVEFPAGDVAAPSSCRCRGLARGARQLVGARRAVARVAWR